MVAVGGTAAEPDVRALPLAPRNPLPYLQQMRALRAYHSGCETLRDAGGPVTRLVMGPKWLGPQAVVVTSPRGGHDMIGRTEEFLEKTVAHDEMRHLLGGNLVDLNHDAWLPRRRAIQPVFTKKRVSDFAGHMTQAAEAVTAGWADGAEIDLDAECRKLTMRALGRSVLGLDLDERADGIAEPIRVTMTYIADRVSRVHAPRRLPTPARRRARAASAALHGLAAEILRKCRADPDHDAPLVRALMTATDPETGRALSDQEICDELIAFMAAGHDTTATTLAYALWALGRHPDMQARVAAEAAALGARELTAADVASLDYTVAVLHEALRLCPPAPAISRVALRDIEVDGYRVEKGTVLLFGIYAVQRDPALWDRPLEFDPDRFLGRRYDHWQYLPFGAGPRSCIGDHFAMLEATLALATVVRDVEIVSRRADFPLALPMTMVAAEPVPATVRPRTAA